MVATVHSDLHTMSPSKYNFQGKVALVTGSSSGIGAAIAEKLAEYGAEVVITGRDPKALAEVGKKIHKATGKVALEIVADLLNDDTPTKLITETITKFGRLDILVNNAGGASSSGKLVDNPNLLKEFDQVFKLNVRSVVELTQLAVPHLEKTKGNVLNISSMAAMRPYSVVYSASKAAVDMITKTSAQELGCKGIRVNSVNPGFIRTNFGRSMGREDTYKDAETVEYLKKFSPMHRIGEPEEIANLVRFLVSDEAANMTGGIYVSDSGVLVGTPQ